MSWILAFPTGILAFPAGRQAGRLTAVGSHCHLQPAGRLDAALPGTGAAQAPLLGPAGKLNRCHTTEAAFGRCPAQAS